jgi:hypothetical protein
MTGLISLLAFSAYHKTSHLKPPVGLLNFDRYGLCRSRRHTPAFVVSIASDDFPTILMSQEMRPNVKPGPRVTTFWHYFESLGWCFLTSKV